MEMLTYAMTLGNYITKLASTMKSLLRGRHRPKLREREVDGSVQAVQVGGLVNGNSTLGLTVLPP